MTFIYELLVRMGGDDQEVKVSQPDLINKDCGVSEKKLRRREQNRRAARTHRAKRRQEALSVIEDYKKFMSANTNIKHTVKQLEREKEQLQRILSSHLEDHQCRLQATEDQPQTSHEPQQQYNWTYNASNQFESIKKPKIDRPVISDHFGQQQNGNSNIVFRADYSNLAYSNSSAMCLYPNVTRSISSTVSSPQDVSVGGSLSPEVLRDRESGARQPNRGLIPTVIDLIEDD